jgi:aminoglycoside phosphotransferase (APT) family kinase protein
VTSASALERSFEGPVSPARLETLWSYVENSGLDSLVLGASKDLNAKVTVLLVSPQSGRPLFAIKAPTTDASERAVEAEVRMLRDLEGLPFMEGSPTIPRVVDLVEFDGRIGAVMTAVPGTPLTTLYLQWRHVRVASRVMADFAAVGSWLADFQRATSGELRAVDMDGGVTERLRARFGEERHLDADLDWLARIHERLRSDAVPRTAVHGDFWSGNLLMDGRRLAGVVDWEAGSISGEPVRDLVRFPLMYALYLDRRTRRGRRVAGHPGLVAGAWGAGIEYALDGAGWFPEHFRAFLRDGLARLGASPESWRDAALAGIAEVAALTDDDAFARFHLKLLQRLRGVEGSRSS